MNAKYYLHPPGYPSRFGVVDVGLKCVHECGFCFYLYMDGSSDPTSGMRHAKFHSKEHVLGLVDGLADQNFVGFDVTGGEPALHPNIIDIAERATERGLVSRIITLGQFLQRPMHGRKGKLIDELLAAGLTDFRLSVHECAEEEFKALTGGSWAKQKANMDDLDAKGFQYMTNTTINQKNYKRLPLIAKEIARHNVYNATILFMMAHYQWSENGHAKEIQSRYTDAAKYCREYVDILESNKIPVIVRYAPLCTIAGLEKNHVGAVGVRYDPHEWMNAMDHKLDPEQVTPEITRAMTERVVFPYGEPSDQLHLISVNGLVGTQEIVGGRGASSTMLRKLFPKECKGCSAMPVCDGVEPQYLERFGGSEFVPYLEDNRGQVLDRERMTYLPAYYVKLQADADMKAVIGRAFAPTPVSANPKVSVIVTCYNYGKYLRECLDSIVAQTYDNLEVHVVDDGSTDDTQEIVAEFGLSSASRWIWRYTKTAHTGQPAYPRNRGVKESDGELIVCLDADDKLGPTYIEECVQALRRHPECAIAYTGVTCFGDKDEQWIARPFDYGTEIQQNFISCASMYRREVWDAVGGYATNCRGVEDYEFWIKACGAGFVGINVPRQLWFYRVHADGIFSTDVEPNFEDKFRQIVLNNPQLYPPQMVTMAKAGEKVQRLLA